MLKKSFYLVLKDIRNYGRQYLQAMAQASAIGEDGGDTSFSFEQNQSNKCSGSACM